MANLFKAAKENSKPVSAKATKEEIVIKNPAFHRNLARLAELNQQIDDLVSEQKILHAEAKEIGISKFIEMYESSGKFTGSFNIVARGAKNTPDASLMFIPTDSYSSIDKDRFNDLASEYGEEIVQEHDSYVMNTDMVEKYGEIISQLISKSKLIAEEDKHKLISVNTKYTIRKGTISNLLAFDKDLKEIIADVRPTFQIKNIKLDNEI